MDLDENQETISQRIWAGGRQVGLASLVCKIIEIAFYLKSKLSHIK
jgi:hypothetical protein